MNPSSTPSPDASHDAGSRPLPALLVPGVQLFRRWRFGAKAAVISLAFSVPLAVLGGSYALERTAQLNAVAQEREGVHLARSVAEALRITGLHTRQVLMQAAGAAAPSAQPAPLAPALEAATAALQPHADLPGVAEALKTVAATRQGLAGADAGLVKVYATHARLNAALVKLLDRTADGSGLTLDPEAESYFAMDAAVLALPALADQAARMQGLSSAASQAGQGGPVVEQEMVRQDALLELYADRLASALGKVLAQQPQRAAALEAKPALAALARLRDVATDSPGGGGATQAAKVQAAGEAAVTALWSLQAQTLQALDEMLAERAGSLQRAALATAAGTLGCVAIAAYLFYAFYLVMRSGLGQVSLQLRRLGDGDLSQSLHAQGSDEVADLLREIEAMRHGLSRTLLEVRSTADEVAVAARQLATGTEDLARRTEQTAGQLQQSASAMAQMSATVATTTTDSRQAAALAGENAQVSSHGGKVIGEVVSTMADIHASSGKVVEIIGVIDGIAFQTNILALNAAVEAARAGEAGRGFAVVATEVRQLAQRSAAAAREIKGLIETSVQRATDGARVVREAGDTMSEIVGNAQRIDHTLGRITHAAQEQAQGIAEVSATVTELDRLTQQNAALVEESSAAAAAMQDRAAQLAREAARFRLPAA